MKKFSKFLLSLIVVTGLWVPIGAQAYTVEQGPIQFSYQPGFTFGLDDGTPYGIKTHEWTTNNWWGDDTYPYGYWAQCGVSKARLA